MVELYTTDRHVRRFAPVYHRAGQWPYVIERRAPGQFIARRSNVPHYGQGGAGEIGFATKEEALAWCQADYDSVTGGGAAGFALTSYSPNPITVGYAGGVTVMGSGFDATTEFYFDGAQFDPSWVLLNSDTQVTLTAPTMWEAAGEYPLMAYSNTLEQNTNELLVNVAAAPVVIPALFAVSPNSAYIGHPGLSVQAVGNKFTAGSVAKADGAPKTTTFTSATALTFDLPAADLVAGKTLNITISNDGGPDSDFRPFYVTGAAPVQPVITTLSPASMPVGSVDTLISIIGTGFDSGCVATLNGTLTESFVTSETNMQTTIPASLMAAEGTIIVGVNKQGVGASNEVNFPVTVAAAPDVVISTLTPASVVLGAPDTTFTVSGSGFAAGDVVHADGNNILATTFVDASTLTAVFPGTLTGYAWSFTLEIYRADAAVSNQMPFPVTAARSSAAKQPPARPGAGSRR